MRAGALLAAAGVLLGAPGTALASPTQESVFQDDQLQVRAAPPAVAATLDELRSLGVDRVRVSLTWRAIAPAAGQDAKPARFDAADPAQYPGGAWAPYDTVLGLARERGMDVSFVLATPAPDWATGTPARAAIDQTFDPSAEEFGRFARAAATRYDGAHGPPRVTSWSIGDEPNDAGRLTPQWIRRGDGWVEAAPRIYRALVRAAWAAFMETGHAASTVLIGETAPKGAGAARGSTRAIDAQRFIRRLYCLDDNLQVLQGADATAQDCPDGDQIASFPARNPGLFAAGGWAHHPYELRRAPGHAPERTDWATMGNLEDLQSLLRRIHQRYARPLEGDVPLHLTRFGYQTDPPDPRGVSPARQAAYLGEAEYVAWRNRDVRAFGQFLLRDGGSPVARTFQSGLRTARGARKPAWNAYRFPIHVPRPALRRGQRLHVWGLPRPAADGSRPRVRVEFRREGTRRWRRLATVRGDDRKGYVNASLRPPGDGDVRLRFGAMTSRAVPVTLDR